CSDGPLDELVAIGPLAELNADGDLVENARIRVTMTSVGLRLAVRPRVDHVEWEVPFVVPLAQLPGACDAGVGCGHASIGRRSSVGAEPTAVRAWRRGVAVTTARRDTARAHHQAPARGDQEPTPAQL